MDNFYEVDYPFPPSILLSVYGSSAHGTEPVLHYAVPLVGVASPVTVYIHRSLRTASLPPSTSNC